MKYTAIPTPIYWLLIFNLYIAAMRSILVPTNSWGMVYGWTMLFLVSGAQLLMKTAKTP